MFIIRIRTTFRLKNPFLPTFTNQHAFLRTQSSSPHKWGSVQMRRELKRQERDRRWEKIVQDERRKEIRDDEKENSSTELTVSNYDDNNSRRVERPKHSVDEFNSLVVSEYFEKNYQRFSADFPEVVKELDAKRATSGQLSPNTSSRTKKSQLPQYPLKKLTPVIIDKNFSSKDLKKLADKKSVGKAAVGGKLTPLEEKITPDRGFFVYQNEFKDEYELGTALALPQDKQSLILKNQFNKGVPMTFRQRYGADDAVEEIEFQLPHQNVSHYQITSETLFEDDWTLRYGVADPTVPAANRNCPACGAQFHCQNASLPGFLPAEYFHECSAQNFADVTCRRCYLMKTHNFLLNVNVSKIDYESMLSKLRMIHEVLIILIVDMTDFPCSFYKNLPELIGYGKHVILVGNKIDLIPPDSCCEDYLKHYRHCLFEAARTLEFDKKLNIMKTFLISAKTGYNIEYLVTYIQTVWQTKGDIYLVGCTNSGKSTLFNAFLQSDLCKIRAADLVERATTSIWPGTTMSLLKFPMMNPTGYRLQQRSRRLAFIRQQEDEEEYHRQLLLEETGDPQYAVLQGYIGKTFELEEEFDPNSPTSLLHMMPEAQPKKKSSLDLTNPVFTSGNWCYDTPGTVNDDQILNILTLDELVKTVPNSLMLPRTVVLHRYNSLFIGGLVRIDHYGPTQSVFLTVFASDQLPLNVVERREAVEFYKEYFGTGVLGVPFGNEDRLRDFPLLVGKSIRLVGFGPKEACADIVLSSVGWASVTARQQRRVDLRVWTPDGRGVHVRPALVPFANEVKGRRIEGTEVHETERLKVLSRVPNKLHRRRRWNFRR